MKVHVVSIVIMALMLAACRKLVKADASIKSGEWNRSIKAMELKDKVVGVIGLNKIGGGVVTRLKAFGCEVIGCDPYISEKRVEDLGVKLVTLDELVKTADVISLHVPLNDETRNLIDAPQLKLMKDGVIHQIDTPLQIYNHPANVFVAGFIGSPAINMVTGKLSTMDGNLVFDSGDYQLKLTPELQDKLKNYENKAIIMGIRPEDIYDARHDSMAEFPQQFTPTCDLVEPLGSEFHVVLKTKQYSFVARLDPKELPQIGQELPVSVDMAKAHFFDPESEETLI